MARSTSPTSSAYTAAISPYSSTLVLPLAAYGGAATARDVAVKPIAEARLRYEHIDQAGLPERADALTLRLRAGGQATLGSFSALVEGEATVAPVGR